MEQRDPQEYIQHGPFDKTAFTAAYTAEFKDVPKFNAASIPDLVHMLEMMEQDPTITDLRWMAYMLATAFIESSTTVKVKKQSTDKRGHPVVRAVKVWRNFSPIEEKGHGKTRKYGKPVKVKHLPDGTARVTEYDGEQWKVTTDGHAHPVHRHQKRGVDPALIQADQTYLDDDGVEKYYYGRGFVQLTWWNNYAATGALLGRGLDLLFEPDLVDDPKLAYQIISTGMRTGKGFANKHTFSNYFHGSHTDYVHARAMVNGKSGEHEVGAIAERFESVLFAARPNLQKTAAK